MFDHVQVKVIKLIQLMHLISNNRLSASSHGDNTELHSREAQPLMFLG